MCVCVCLQRVRDDMDALFPNFIEIVFFSFRFGSPP